MSTRPTRMRNWPSELRAQQARRALRRQLGLCTHCIEPAMPGYRACDKHLKLNRIDSARSDAKKAKARGWVYRRVEI